MADRMASLFHLVLLKSIIVIVSVYRITYIFPFVKSFFKEVIKKDFPPIYKRSVVIREDSVMERKYSLLKRGGKAAAGGAVLGLALLLSLIHI